MRRSIGFIFLALLVTSPPNAWALANPASVFCAKGGGKSEIRKGPRGQYGVCRLPDGRVGRVGLLPCDEGKARPLEDSPTHRSASAIRDAVQVNGGPYSSGMSAIGTLSTWCPCWSTTETNHPCQFRPGVTLPCLSSLASTTAS